MDKKIILGWAALFLILLQGAVFGSENPKLKFLKIIGDMRGKGGGNIAVTVKDDGTIYLLMTQRLSVFDKDGNYQKSLKMSTAEFYPAYTVSLNTAGNRILLGDYRKDYPWVFSDQRQGNQPGNFLNPGQVVSDENGTIYVADTGNSRIQIFTPANTEKPKEIITLTAKPTNLAVRKNLLAILAGDQSLLLYEVDQASSWKASLNIGTAAQSISVGPDSTILVAFRGGPDRYQLKRYRLDQGSSVCSIKEVATVAPSYMDSWPEFFPASVSMVLGPDGEIWYGSDLFGAVLSLDPKTDKIRTRIGGLNRPIAVGFGTSGKVYVGGSPVPNTPGANLTVYSENGSLIERFPATGVLYENLSTPVFGLLPDRDGGVYLRIVDQNGGKNFNLKKVYPDGTRKDFFSLEDIWGKRTTYHPLAMYYSLSFDQNRNIIMSCYPWLSVIKLSPEGKIIWEAGPQPQGGADKVEFAVPFDISVDSKDNIWVVDCDKNKLFCLSPSGKLLFDYGGFANVDDVEGKGFDGPTGVEIVKVADKEYLYVGDVGNGRIIKYEIVW